MVVYYVVLILTTFFCGTAHRYDIVSDDKLMANRTYKHSKTALQLFVLTVAILVFVAGFRYYVGTDFSGYYNGYERYADEFFDRLIELDEPGYAFISWLTVLVGGDGVMAIFLSSLLTIGLFSVTIYKYSDNLFFATILYIFLGCWHGGFNGVRQYLAATVVFFGFKYIREKKLLKYLLCIFIAFLFHASASVMVLAYFVVYRKVNFANVMILAVGSIVALYSFDRLLEIAGFILDNEYELSNDYITNSVNALRVLAAVAPPVLFLIMYYKRELTDYQNLCMNLLIMNAVVRVATSNSTYLARAGIYTAPFLIIAIPELLKGLNKSNRRIITVVTTLAYAYFWWYEVSNGSALNNFQFVFTN